MSNLTPEGTYPAKLADMKFGQSTNGKDQMEWIVDVQVSTTDIRRRSIMGYFTGGAAQYTEERLHAMGFNGDFEQPACDPKFYTEGCEVYVKHEPYDDGKGGGPKMLEKWAFSRTSRTKPATDDAKASMSQRWRAKYGSAPAAQAPTPKPPVTPAPPVTPKGPPPPVEPAGDVWTKDRAWEHWSDEYGAKLNPDQWKKVVQGVLNGRTEKQLTSDDWKAIADAAAIPF